MRRSDAECIAKGTAARDLISRAASVLFEAVDWKAPVLLCCGSGNNAADGYALALRLREAGLPCEILRLSPRCSPEGGEFLSRCREAGIPDRLWAEGDPLPPAATVVDCLFGTGFRGEPAGAYRAMIEAINAAGAAGAFVVSADINSGLHGDSGQGEICVRSDLTVSFGAFQPGHFLGRAKDVIKRKTCRDVGIAPAEEPYHLLEPADVAAVFPPRLNDSHKGTYGYCALLGGSLRYGGAVRLAAMANAAMRAGAGVARVGLPRSLAPAFLPLILESTLCPLPDREGSLLFREEALAEAVTGTKAAAFGMGAGLEAEGETILTWLLAHYPAPLLVDADGLTFLSRLPRQQLRDRTAPLILTPHVKEFSRLSGLTVPEILSNPIPVARAYAADTGAVVLLKGPATVITDGKSTLLTDTGCPGMATAGSGDVLSGILTALLSAGAPPLLAAAAAAWINGRAGELAQSRVGAVSMVASDTVAALPEVIRGLPQAN